MLLQNFARKVEPGVKVLVVVVGHFDNRNQLVFFEAFSFCSAYKVLENVEQVR